MSGKASRRRGRRWSGYLVLVAGADAAAGGADGAVAALVEALLLDVVGEDDVGVVADDEVVRADGDARGLQRADLFEEAHRVDHDAVADDGAHVRRQDAGRQQRQLVGLATLDDCVAGVGAAVVADDDVMVGGEQIDDFPLGLVAPLQADDTGGGHVKRLNR